MSEWSDEQIENHHAYVTLSGSDVDDLKPAMRLRIVRLLLEAPKLDGADREAVQCHVMLTGQPQPLFGSLSYTDEGLLKMMTPSKVKHEGQPERTIMLEQYFDVHDVVAIMVEREMKVERSRIIGVS